jgi:hypothetical protein
MFLSTIINSLKKIKYFLIHHNISGYFYLILKLFLNGKIIKNFFYEHHFPNIGKFKNKINILDFEEIKILDKNYYDHPNLQSFRNFNIRKNNFFLFSDNKLIINFFSKTLKIKFYLISNINFFHKNVKHIKENNVLKIIKNKKNVFFFEKNNKYSFNNKIQKYSELIFTRKKIILSSLYKYKFNQGRIFNKELRNDYYYNLFSPKKINIKMSEKKIISGFCTIKDFNIFPFDLAIESILPYVDEFLLGIDKQSFNQNYNKILNNFLKKTKFKNKIKIYFFDFNSLSTLEMKVRGRWIADANNKILNYCRGEYCFYIQADEVFKKISNDKFKNLFISHPDEIYFNFLHFVFDLETIIKPEKSSYTKAIRIFKKDSYAACHDGFSFQNINSFRPNANYDKHPIYHISYVYNYKKKIKEHFEKKNGLHINQLSKNKFLNEYVITQKIDNIKKEISYLKHMKSFKLIK